jgi:hypothetical protein
MRDKDQDLNEQSFYRIMDRDGWRCQWPGCGRPATERAHRIAKTEANKIEARVLMSKIIGHFPAPTWVTRFIIHHDLNMAASCRAHNSQFNIGNNPEAFRALIAEIFKELKKHGNNNSQRGKQSWISSEDYD